MSQNNPKNTPDQKKSSPLQTIMIAVFAILLVVVVAVRISANTDKTPAKDYDELTDSIGKPVDSTSDDEVDPTDDATDDETPEEDEIDIIIPVEPEVVPDYYADIEIADYGTITVELDGTAAPITVANFVKLANEGFYDGLTLHRIIAGFMMQGGCPMGNGYGGSGEPIKGEFSENGVDNPLSHTRGAISMARGRDMDSGSSQFFIVHEDSEMNLQSLDGKYACFGYVIDGIEIVDAICADAEPTDNNGSIAPEAQPVITKITIRDVETAE